MAQVSGTLTFTKTDEDSDQSFIDLRVAMIARIGQDVQTVGDIVNNEFPVSIELIIPSQHGE